MSIIKQLFPQCNMCLSVFGDFVGHSNVKALRRVMRENGWKRLDGVFDVCPSCHERSKRLSIKGDVT